MCYALQTDLHTYSQCEGFKALYLEHTMRVGIRIISSTLFDVIIYSSVLFL